MTAHNRYQVTATHPTVRDEQFYSIDAYSASDAIAIASELFEDTFPMVTPTSLRVTLTVKGYTRHKAYNLCDGHSISCNCAHP